MNVFAPATAGLRTWKLTLAYDGADFQGWQVQPGKATIQGELQAALGRITGEAVLPQGSGRTDAGVHALAQVASFALRAPIPPQNLLRAFNRTLPGSIRIIEAGTAPNPAFHARHSAIAKTYEYRIFREEICPPFLARYVYACPWPLDFEALAESARIFVGQHDFKSFAASDPDLTSRKAGYEAGCEAGHEAGREAGCEEESGRDAAVRSTVRTIFNSGWEQRSSEAGELFVYRVRGNGFLHHMVRNLVGTMLDAARGHLRVESLSAVLAARSRSAAGPTAPAQGLYLHSVEYDPGDDAEGAVSLLP